MLIPPALQQPAAPAPKPEPKPEPGALAKLLQKRGTVVSLKRQALGALYGKGSLEVERLEASNGADTQRGLGFHVAGPAQRDGEGRAILEAEELPALLDALDRFQAEAAKLAAGGSDTSFTYTSNGGFSMELAREQSETVFTLRAGRGEAVFAANQIAALRQLVEKAK